MAATIRIYGKLCTLETETGEPRWGCPESADLEKILATDAVNERWQEDVAGSGAVPNDELELAQMMVAAHGGEVVNFTPVDRSDRSVVY
jgi:hypothetical protein